MNKITKLKIISIFTGLIIFILFLGLIEFVLYLFNFNVDSGFVIKNTPIFILENKNGVEYYSTNTVFKFRNDSFKKIKDYDTERIFVIGGSAAYGAGVEANQSFSYLLENKLNLQLLESLKKFEVINVAQPGYSSSEDLGVFEEILNYSPDYVVLYSGNNEFLRLIYNYKLKQNYVFEKLSKSRLFSAIRKLLNKFNRKYYSFDEFNYFVPFVSENQTNVDLNKGKEIFDMYLNNYIKNINNILEKARINNVTIILSNIPTNLNWPPTKSQHIVKLDQIDFLNEYETRGMFFSGDCTKALNGFDNLIKKDPYYAEYYFLKGLCFGSMNDTGAELINLKLAKKYDAYPIRQPDEFNLVLEDFAKNKSIVFLDSVELFKNTTGSEKFLSLFLDQTHPNIEGHVVLADAFFNSIKKQFILKSGG